MSENLDKAGKFFKSRDQQIIDSLREELHKVRFKAAQYIRLYRSVCNRSNMASTIDKLRKCISELEGSHDKEETT